eukprot:271708_1
MDASRTFMDTICHSFTDNLSDYLQVEEYDTDTLLHDIKTLETNNSNVSRFVTVHNLQAKILPKYIKQLLLNFVRNLLTKTIWINTVSLARYPKLNYKIRAGGKIFDLYEIDHKISNMLNNTNGKL